MFREIDAECYIMTDGDDTYPAEFAPQMADMVLNKNCDMVVGDRLSSTYFQENKRPFHNFGNDIVRKSINFLFKSKIKDIMTGFRAFSYQFVKTFPVLSTGFEIETEMTIHAVDKNMAVGNVVIDYRDRQEGSESKLNTFSDGFKVIKTIIRLFKAYKPIWFYGLVALILAIISIGFFIPILVIYGETGLVPKFYNRSAKRKNRILSCISIRFISILCSLKINKAIKRNLKPQCFFTAVLFAFA